jgi:hypothetical protein
MHICDETDRESAKTGGRDLRESCGTANPRYSKTIEREDPKEITPSDREV